MKYLISISFILFCFFGIASKVNTTKTLSNKLHKEDSVHSNKKNFVELEFLGRGILYSLNYGRNLVSFKKFHLKTTLGYSNRSFQSRHDHSFPLLFQVNYGEKYQINLGVGVAFLYQKNGYNITREEVLLDSNGLFQGKGAYDYVGKYGREEFVKTGITIKLKNEFAISLNYYLYNFYNYTNLKERALGNYLGFSIIKNF